jgi:catechol 2,3-dioxygenase-like lactoylglutathione lyase family enzyme
MKLDHVNIRTANLAAMRAWYAEALGLVDGWRPGFAFPGAWLYAGEDAVVHLVEVAEQTAGEGRIEHFALQGDDLEAFRARMAAMGVAVREAPVPDAGILQVNIFDPDGNHIHVDFPL